MTDTAMPDTTPDPVAIGPDATVTDAFVDFTGAGKNELYVKTDTMPGVETALPVPSTEDPNTDIIIENDAGLLWGFSNGPVQPPADTSPRTKTTELVHEQQGTIERAKLFEHMTKSRQNDREPNSVLSVHYNPNDGCCGTQPTRVETAQKIVDRYINGPLGTDNASYWWDYQKGDSWSNHRDYEDYEPYITADNVVLATDSIYTWKAYQADNIPDDAEVFVGTEPARKLARDPAKVSTSNE